MCWCDLMKHITFSLMAETCTSIYEKIRKQYIEQSSSGHNLLECWIWRTDQLCTLILVLSNIRLSSGTMINADNNTKAQLCNSEQHKVKVECMEEPSLRPLLMKAHVMKVAQSVQCAVQVSRGPERGLCSFLTTCCKGGTIVPTEDKCFSLPSYHWSLPSCPESDMDFTTRQGAWGRQAACLHSLNSNSRF